MTTVELLERARALIAREGGWRQGLPNLGGDDRICLGVSVSRAARELANVEWAEECAAYKPAYQILQATVGDELIWQWNDMPGRTQAEAVAMMDRAIAAARETAEAEGRE